MAQTHTFTDLYRVRVADLLMPDVTHCAVGDGAVTGAPPPAAAELTHEIGRVIYLSRYFVTPQAGGELVFDGVQYTRSDVPTRFIYMAFRFDADEAQGNWSELGIFGNGVEYVAQEAELVAVGVAGDDKLNVDVVLGGSWAAPDSGSVDVTVSTGGGDGVAHVSWTDTIGGGPGGPVPVTFMSPIALGASGATIMFTGGSDGVLTFNDRWRVLGTVGPTRPEYADGGVYDPSGNPQGQVRDPGMLLRLTYMDPVQAKADVFIDVQVVLEVIRP